MTEQLPTTDYVHHLVKQILNQYQLTNQTMLTEENGKILIKVYDQHSFEQTKKVIEEKLEVGKNLVEVFFVRPKIKSDDWLSKMNDGREGAE